MRRKSIIYIVVTACWLVFSYSVIFIVKDTDRIKALTWERGFFETAGALFFLFSAILFFVAFLKADKVSNLFIIKTKKNIFFLLLSLLFLFAFFEEISWGQKYFHFKTPDSVKEKNLQEEFNLHNLEIFSGRTLDGETKRGLGKMLTVERLSSIFWFTFCIMLPLLCRYCSPIRKFVSNINIPIVPLFIGPFFLVNYFFQKITIQNYFMNPLKQHLLSPIIEIKETNIAFLFFVISVWFILNLKNDNVKSEI
jgi:hypothetical protein